MFLRNSHLAAQGGVSMTYRAALACVQSEGRILPKPHGARFPVGDGGSMI